MNMRASELNFLFAFSHSTTAISFNILLVLTDSFSQKHIYFNAVSFYYLWYGAIHVGLYKRQYTNKTLTLREYMIMRARGTSELRKFSHFHILKRIFPSIFCWYFRYFVGTNDMLVGLNVPTNFQMYRHWQLVVDHSANSDWLSL